MRSNPYARAIRRGRGQRRTFRTPGYMRGAGRAGVSTPPGRPSHRALERRKGFGVTSLVTNNARGVLGLLESREGGRDWRRPIRRRQRVAENRQRPLSATSLSNASARRAMTTRRADPRVVATWPALSRPAARSAEPSAPVTPPATATRWRFPMSPCRGRRAWPLVALAFANASGSIVAAWVLLRRNVAPPPGLLPIVAPHARLLDLRDARRCRTLNQSDHQPSCFGHHGWAPTFGGSPLSGHL